MEGYIHSIESFGLVDGPGVRCIVFLQGCRMRCRYCHNPDTWAMTGGTKWDVEALFKKIVRFRPYWKDNGGITISGGEALLQMDFVTELFYLAKKEGIHTAIDTSGEPFRPEEDYLEKFHRLMDLTDLFILDIKEMDTEKHKKLTGCTNDNILRMAGYLSDHNKDMWIRHVLVPDLTDQERELRLLADFLGTLNTVKKVEILPYHTLGVHKWESMGIPYSLKNTLPPTKEKMEWAEKILKREL